MGDIDLQSALQMFTAGVKDLQVARTISGANQAVDQIRNSELKDEEKNNQLRNVAQQLTFGLAAQGVPGTTIQAVAGFAPPKNDVSSPFGRFVNGTPEQRQQVRDYEQSQTDQKIAIENAAMEKALAVQGLKNEGKTSQLQNKPTTPIEVAKLGDAFSKEVDSNSKVRSALGAAAISKQQTDKIKAIVGGDTSDAHLNSLPPQFVKEVAAGIVRQVQGGAASEGTFREFIPHNVKMDAASLQNYLTSGAAGANQAPIIRKYLETANREAGVAQSNIEDAVLKTASGHPLRKLDPETLKAKVAAHIETSPDQVVITPEGSVTTKDRQLLMDKYDSYMKGLTKAKAMLANPKTAAEGAQTLKDFGFDPRTPLNEIDQELKYRVRSKTLE